MAKAKKKGTPSQAAPSSTRSSTAPDSCPSSPGKTSEVAQNKDQGNDPQTQQPPSPATEGPEDLQKTSVDTMDSSQESNSQNQADVFTAPGCSKQQRPLPPLPSAGSKSGLPRPTESSTTISSIMTRESSSVSLARSNSSSSTIHELDGKAQNIVVAVRIRPAKLGCTDAIWTVTDNTIKLSPNHPLIKARGSSSRSAEDAYTFRFDSVLSPSQTTRDLYQDKVAPGVQAAMDGFNSTIFAYGQTGSGKTHTMMGTEDDPGIVHQAIQEVFSSIQADNSRTYLLRISYLEIYNETLRDLLSPGNVDAPLKIREKSKTAGTPSAGAKGNTVIYVDPLHEEVVAQPSDVFDALDRGESNRHVGTTDWNLRSSRSHCVFTLTIESALKTPGLPGSTKISQLNLIDLAGSEKMSTGSGDATERNAEGSHINKSLLALGNVIAKLSSSQKGHIPYRDSKLTRLLQPSLGGNARVAIVCTVSADPAQAAESVSTLKFARNAKQVVTKAERGHVINDQSALIQKYKKELDNLRQKLEVQNKAIATAEDSAELERAKAEHQRQLGQLVDERAKAEEEISDMRQRRLQLSNELQHLTKLLLTGQGAAAEHNGPVHSEEAILKAAGPAGSSTRQAYSRRISEIGLGLTTPRKTSAPANGGSARSFSTKLDNLATPRVGSIEKETELEATIERLNLAARQKDDTIFRLETESKSVQNRFEFLEQESTEQAGHIAELKEQAEKVSSIQEELASITEEKDRLLKDLQDSQLHEDQLKSELAAAQVNLESTTSEGVKVSEVLKERDECINQLRSELKSLQETLKERKAELDRVNSKTAATARLLSSLSHSRDQAESRVQEAEARSKTATERAETAEEALVLLQQSLIDSRLAWERKEQELLAEQEELYASRQHWENMNSELQVEKVGAEESWRNDRLSLEARLSAMNDTLTQREEELSRLRETRRPTLPATSHGPSAEDLTAKLGALQNSAKTSETSRLSAAPVTQESDRSAVLQLTVSEQQAKIEELETALRESYADAAKAAAARPRPSTSLGHSTSSYRDRTSSARVSSDEVERLNQVIDSQKVTISDLQEDLHQWRKRMHAQRDLIRNLQAEGVVGAMDLSAFATPVTSPTRGRSYQSPASSLPSRFQRMELGSRAAGDRSPRISPPASTVSSRDDQRSSPPTTVSDRSVPSSPPLVTKQRDLGLGILTPSRRPYEAADHSATAPLSTPKHKAHHQTPAPADSPSRSARRKTIESDLARLQDSRAVEKQKTALMTPRAAQAKQQRVLSGIQQRVQAQQRMLDDENSGNSSWRV